MARVNVTNQLSGAVLEVEGDKSSLDYWAGLGYVADKPAKKAPTKKAAAKKSSK